jgi:hypothetical protein
MRFISDEKTGYKTLQLEQKPETRRYYTGLAQDTRSPMPMPLKHDNDNPVRKPRRNQRLIVAICITAVATAFGGMAVVGQEMLRIDPRRPTRMIARDLGIAHKDFIYCFNEVKQTQTPLQSADAKHEDTSGLLACLRTMKASITDERLGTLITKYHPGGRSEQ